jgi:uncharacterized repeat protein (TIGR01451 family)
MRPTRRLSLIPRAALALTLLVASAALQRPAVAAPAAAGTNVTNTATAYGVDSGSGLSARLASNPVTSVVQALEGLNLAGGQTASGSPGNSFTLPHQLTNTGNTTSSVVLTLATTGGSFTPSGLEVVVDANGNGVVDPGESVIANGGSIPLSPGAHLSLLIVGAIPTTALTGQSVELALTARSQSQGATASSKDTVNVAGGASLSVSKSASSGAPKPNSTLTYTLNALNTGSAAANPVPLTVNGNATALVVLRDSVPANTTLSAASAAASGVQVLYHRLTDPDGAYVSVLEGGATVDAVAWGVPTLAAGATLTGTLTVTVNDNAAGTLANTGYADFENAGTRITSPSNAVNLPLPALMPTIMFYTDNAYTTPTQQAVLAAPLFVQVNAAQCNTNASVIVTHPITLVSAMTGDTEMFTATETAPNTGLFRILPDVPTADAATHVAVSGDGILEVLPNDRVTATLAGCGVTTTSANVLVDPSGVVFNSKTNLPVTGAAVQLIDVTGAGNGGHPGAAAKVFAVDGVTPAPSTVVTLANGSYSFPLVPASTYRLVVTPPNGYAFPSKLPPGLLPAGRNISPTGSYGGSFVVAAMGSPIALDIPVDSGAAGGLFVQKSANKSAAAVGDLVDYLVTISNNTGIVMPATVVDDALPAGFAYVPGTARLNGAPLADPAGGSGPALSFRLGAVAPATQTLLTYRTRIGPAGQAGSGINTAQAESGSTRSNLATATVKVGGSALSTDAYLFGKVFADCNADRIQGDDEPGIPGVRIMLDDGTYAITDIEGKYSLYGLSPRTHVAKVDSTSLPAHTTLRILNNRNALDAGSQFVDLQSGELHKADFAIAECSAAVRADIAARRDALKSARSEITTAATSQIQINATAVADPRTLGATGLIGQKPAGGANDTAAGNGPGARNEPGGGNSPSGGNSPGAHDDPRAGNDPGVGQAVVPDPLEKLLPTLSPDLDFMNLVDGGIVPSAQTAVRVKGAFGTQLTLTVNGTPIGRAQVAEQSSLESRGVTAWEYLGIDLKPGENLLELSMVDAFGNVRGTRRLHVIAPGPLATLKFVAPESSNADPETPLEVEVDLEDAAGVPVNVRTELTLETTQGAWRTRDLDPKEPGVQVFVEGGRGHFLLTPPANPGKATLRASSGGVHAELPLTFLPNLRPMIAVGMAEGIVSLHNLNPSAVVPAQSGDSFEQQIMNVSSSFDSGKGDAAARTSLYLKGKVLGSDLLTLAYDSDKSSDTPLFRDIQPDLYYPVYGDSSVKGYDAQSTGKLYVRLDHGTSYGVYGDFSTQSDNPARVLTQYTRALNGAKTHIEDGPLTIDGFASYSSSTQVIDELPANGTSGPYQLSQRDPVLNSERVDVLTRDRNQPSIVLADQPLTQFTDYAVDAFGQILFKAPIPSVDANLNPITIHVAYEVSNGGPSYWVGGLDVRDKVTHDLTLGGVLVRDANPVTKETLGGADFLWAPNHDTSLVGELAGSQSDLAGSGAAHRVELKHTDSRIQARLYAVQTDANFDNPSSTYTAGTAQYGAKVSAAFDARNRLIIDAIKTTTSGTSIESPLSIPLVGVNEAVPGGGSQQGESIAFEHSLTKQIKLTTGVRHEDSNGVATEALALGAVPVDYTSVRARVDVPVPDLPRANAYVQYEEAVDDSSLKDTTVGATYQLALQTKIYATHQTSNSLSGDYLLSPTQQDDLTVVGIDTQYMQDGKTFDEYRVGDGVDGRSAQAAIGLRNLWTLAPGLGVSTSIQQVHPISGVVTDTATALTAALQYTASANWKASTRVEWSESDTAETWLSSIGAAMKVDPDLTLLARGVYNEQVALGTATGSIYLRQGQIGLAYRPVDNDVWNAIAYVEHKRSLNETLGPGLDTDESANIFSSHLNFQVDADWIINGRYAIKRETDYADGVTGNFTAQVLGARSIWDLNSRWDAGLQCFVEWGGAGFGTHQQAAGGEVGYLVMKNIWLSIGYNVTGFVDTDLTSEDYTQRAFYLRLRVKFDENLFKPSHNAEALPANTELP